VASQYDFVIIGGGSAGSALANRLSADPGTSVLVLEAGRSDYPWDVFIHMPAALAFPIGSRFYDWKYESEPEPYMGGRRVYHARGKVLGGSSSINGMIFQRGNPMDYERWASDPGMETWDHAHCLPYFKRMENCLAAAPDDPFRGHDGPLVLERGPAKGPLFDAFFEAVQQAGYPLTDDVNGYRQEGFAKFDRNVHDGKRLSAARAYLHPVMKRPNLTVETFAAAAAARCGQVRWSCAAARSTRRSCSSSPASARRASCEHSASTWWRTSPAWARTSRTTSRSISSTARRSRSRWRRTSR
jgi:choline dehydrogenase